MPVAKRIKTLRESRGFSLRALAVTCDVSPSTLSQVEQGVTSPSVATLEKLAHGLRIPMASFFVDDEEDQAVEVLNLNECATFTLRGNVEPGGMLAEQPFLVGIESEFVWIRSGSATLYYDGTEITLNSSQAVYYDPRRSHNWHNPNDIVCDLFLVRQR
jgi:transcriptional regulator with XRE-family HTH domain